MAETNVNALSAKTTPGSNDVMILADDTSNAGSKITFDNLATAVLAKAGLTASNAWLYRNIPQNKDISNAWYNGSLKSEVAAGNFANVRPGNYIIGSSTGKKYWVVDFDLYYQHGSSSSFTKHHLVMMPAFNTGSNKMNESNTTAGGYLGSYMHTDVLPGVVTSFLTPDFGANLLDFPVMVSNTVTTSTVRGNGLTGASTNREWITTNCILPTEVQVYGYQAYGNAYDTGNSKEQLAMFRLCTYNKVVGRDSMWLRDVASSSYFAYAYASGSVSYSSASNTYGVRPVFLLGT